MMSTTTIGLTAGSRLLGSSDFYSNTTEKLSCSSDLAYTFIFAKNAITAKKSSNRDSKGRRALKEHASVVQSFDRLEDEGTKHELSVEALLLLQKSLLEKQWEISTKVSTAIATPTEIRSKKVYVTGSQISARKRRLDAQKKTPNNCSDMQLTIGPELFRDHFKGRVKDESTEVLLTHSEVIVLSKKIKTGLNLEEQKLRLKKKLGSEPSEEQLATSMRISRTNLRTIQIECTLARQKLTLSNVRLVMSIAQRYDNMGAQMTDLIQGGLIGLLRGIERYDSSRGFKMSTYVYWWIRQGVSRALMENSRIQRLPTHLHERQSAIRNAKVKLEEQGITPSIDRIAESLNISRRKVMNAIRAITKVFSLDRRANGHLGQTLDTDIADNCMENDPWHGVDEAALKDEVNKLISTTLRERERYIICLYYGLDNECLTWEEIGKRIGLSREGVRKIGLAAVEKLKHAAKKARLEAMLVKH